MPFKQHLGHAARRGPLADERNGSLEREVGDTRDVAAVDAQEVRVARVATFALQFKSPDVVAKLKAVQKADIGQLHEIAVDRGPIESLRCKIVGHLGMRHRPNRAVEVAQDGQPSGSAA